MGINLLNYDQIKIERYSDSIMTELSSEVINQSEIDPAEDQIDEPRQLNRSSSRFALDVAGAAIFGALSIVVSALTTPYLPRVEGWGIAYIDPVSIIWLMAFLIFGIRCGLLTFVIGTIGLIPFDLTFWIGPFMKFTATISFIVIPYYFAKVRSKRIPTGEDLRNLKNYIPSVALALLIRIPLMFVMNVIVLKAWGFYDFASLAWLGQESISGLTAIFITVVLINILQSIWDSAIPYLLVYSTKIYDRFKIW